MVKVTMLALIIGYWLLLYAIVGMAGSPFEGDFTVGTPPNVSITSGNITGVDSFFQTVGNATSNIIAIAGFVLFGVGLPDYIPVWFALLFALWNTFISVVFIGVVVSFFVSS